MRRRPSWSTLAGLWAAATSMPPGDLRGIFPGFHNGRNIQIESQELGSASPPSARTV